MWCGGWVRDHTKKNVKKIFLDGPKWSCLDGEIVKIHVCWGGTDGYGWVRMVDMHGYERYSCCVWARGNTKMTQGMTRMCEDKPNAHIGMDGRFPKISQIYIRCWMMRGDTEGHGWVRMDRFGCGSVHLCVGTRGNTEKHHEKEPMTRMDTHKNGKHICQTR